MTNRMCGYLGMYFCVVSSACVSSQITKLHTITYRWSANFDFGTQTNANNGKTQRTQDFIAFLETSSDRKFLVSKGKERKCISTAFPCKSLRRLLLSLITNAKAQTTQ